MLARLAIRGLVLIEQLDLPFSSGFSALTGETGAGKSILLDALGLALGARGDARLVRDGAELAVVTAVFELPRGHPAHALLAEHGLAAEGSLILRRILARDGRSRGSVNDQPATIGLMRTLGSLLVEIQGQSEQHGLADAQSHRAALDAFGGLEMQADALSEAWRRWGAARAALDDHRASAAASAADEDYLRHSLGEIDTVDPKPGEDEQLQAERRALMNRERLIEAARAAMAELGGGRPVEGALRGALRHLERVAAKPGDLFEPARAALDRAATDLGEAWARLEAAGTALAAESGRLQAADDRLFALRDLARKHRVEVTALPRLRDELGARLASILDRGTAEDRLEEAAARAREGYLDQGRRLGAARTAAARRFDAAIRKELPPLKLEKARFETRIDLLPDAQWSAGGLERVAFEAATLPGAALAPLALIASGGELARFMLAVKVVLARSGAVPTLVFDEVDSGIGGATAAAVGERLARLGHHHQVLVVTHSPQVAARADHHWRVEKQARGGGRSLARVEALSGPSRREEIARMLSGAAVTEEARRAADRLFVSPVSVER